jgi:hypothetical protein
MFSTWLIGSGMGVEPSVDVAMMFSYLFWLHAAGLVSSQ